MASISDYDLFLIIVIYYPTYTNKIAKVICKINKIRSIKFTQIVINNNDINLDSVRKDFSFLGNRFAICNHDNSGMEFGAYQKGLDELHNTLNGSYELLVCNDTFGTHTDQQEISVEYLKALLRSLNNSSFPSRAVGTICHVPRTFSIQNLTTSRWIRTSIFGLDKEALIASNYKIYCPEIESFVTDKCVESEFFTDSIGSALQKHIAIWLFSKTGKRWRGAEPLSQINSEKFANKARSIIQEKYLTMRLENAGVALLDPEYTLLERRLHQIKTRLLKNILLRCRLFSF